MHVTSTEFPVGRGVDRYNITKSEEAMAGLVRAVLLPAICCALLACLIADGIQASSIALFAEQVEGNCTNQTNSTFRVVPDVSFLRFSCGVGRGAVVSLSWFVFHYSYFILKLIPQVPVAGALQLCRLLVWVSVSQSGAE